MSRLRVLLPISALVLALSGAALAANGYRVWGTAQHRPHTGAVFTVLSHGRTPAKALLTVFLDRQTCAASWKSESKRFTSSRAGQSTFSGTGRASVTMWVNGQFSKAFNARAGTTAEPEYACSYLTTRDAQGKYTVTAGRRSNAYFVTS